MCLIILTLGIITMRISLSMTEIWRICLEINNKISIMISTSIARRIRITIRKFMMEIMSIK